MSGGSEPVGSVVVADSVSVPDGPRRIPLLKQGLFTSLRSKTVALIIVVLMVTASAIMYFTHRDVGRAMRIVEEASAQNVLELVELNIRAGYNRLVSDKIEILRSLQTDLEHISTVAASVFSDYYEMANTGAISREEGRSRILRWVKSVDLERGELFVFGHDGTLIAHPDPVVEGTSLVGLKDLKGRALAQVMREDALDRGGDGGSSTGESLGRTSAARKWRGSRRSAVGNGHLRRRWISMTSKPRVRRKCRRSSTC